MYEYECEACGHRFEQIQKFSDSAVELCPNCGEEKVRKLVSSPAIQFKGSGWYVNDYARKDSKPTEPSTTPPAASKSDDKPAAATSSTTATPASTSTDK